MPFDLSLPVYFAVALTLLHVLTRFEWPRIRVWTHNETHGGLHVMEIAIILRRAPDPDPDADAGEPAMATTDRPPRPRRSIEFVIYVTLKTSR
jgi:hypothetical protein